MPATNIREFRDQINVQLPDTIQYSIANFSQLSSFDKFPEIIALLEDIKKFSDSPVAYFDTFECVEKEVEVSKEDWDKSVLFMKEISEKLQKIYNSVMLGTKVMREYELERDAEDDTSEREEVIYPDGWKEAMALKYKDEEPW